MIVDLRDGGDTQACILQSAFDVLGLGVACLDPKQTHDRCGAVLDAVAHFLRQQCLVFERVLKPGVRLLSFDRDAKQARETGEEIGICPVELAGIGAVDLKDAEEGLALGSLFDER
ncbi:MAG: hypothetical protein JWR80_4100 [Bradyrhizobium sp.]|nr:hypothetical protein [Bradyrhizobium sp.]